MRTKFGMTQAELALWKDAYNEGYSAGERGLSNFQNPYKNDGVQRDGWNRGWQAAQYNNGRA